MDAKPIFIGVTRSFWLGIVPVVAALVDTGFAALSDQELHAPIAAVVSGIGNAVSWLPDWTVEQVHEGMQVLAAAAGLIIAHQRRHAARPYTLRADEETLT
jgi:hypothetical protein